MQDAISITEIICALHHGTEEICATASAKYDPKAEKVSVDLGAFARSSLGRRQEERFHESWLPHNECVTERLPITEANAFARDAFDHWVKKIRASVRPILASTS